MKEYMETIKKCALFTDIKEENLFAMLRCLNAKEKRYARDEFIFRADNRPNFVGLVLSGSVHVIREDYWGNRTILTSIEPGNLFGESLFCTEAETFPISAVAHRDTIVFLIDYKRILTTCPSACEFHLRLIQNTLGILANKNVILTHKIVHITQKTTKEKVLSYLSEQALLAGSNEFIIPFNRQELADYLSVDRSALSGTLSKMKQEGIIKFHKNKFKLINTP